MLLLKYAMRAGAISLLLVATGFLLVELLRRRRERSDIGRTPSPPIAWRRVRRPALPGLALLLLAESLVLVPAGTPGIRVSQLRGTRPGTLYPGAHLVKPFLESVALYDTRDHVLTTTGADDAKTPDGALRAQSREGLAIGLVLSVRYRLDPERLDSIHDRLPEGPGEELVPAVVSSVFRELVPGYDVREVFATRRVELVQKAAEFITKKLGADGIVVRDVMLRDVVLPPEYAKGLEAVLLKEQQSERMVYELQIKEKEVRSAELEAEAQKAREVKAAEGAARVRVLQAQAEADAMQHTLPLKEKQIQQSRLEAEARKESTLLNAEAAAQAKIIDGKADAERDRMMADAEANRIRVTSSADSERMRLEAAVLKDNPLLIQKIVAEKLSDKMQIMMVPMDGRDFFANDIFRGALGGGHTDPPPATRTATRR
jgi:regulator of protease activity HflC (stomatin/prohibitin superfamily)